MGESEEFIDLPEGHMVPAQCLEDCPMLVELTEAQRLLILGTCALLTPLLCGGPPNGQLSNNLICRLPKDAKEIVGTVARVTRRASKPHL